MCRTVLKADAGEPLLLKPCTPGPHSGNLLHHGNKTESMAEILCTHMGERVRTDVGKGVSVWGVVLRQIWYYAFEATLSFRRQVMGNCSDGYVCPHRGIVLC